MRSTERIRRGGFGAWIAGVAFLAPALGCAPDPGEADGARTANGDRPAAEGAAVTGSSPEQNAFWEGLRAHCGQAFGGRVAEAPPTEEVAGALVMHVRECGEDEIRIPFHIGENRSRTWVVSRTAEGLRLKHDHRLRDGTPDLSNTQYGGDTRTAGSEWRQEFPADEYSIEAMPGRATQYWYLEVLPGEEFNYGLLREATGLRYRYEFDLTTPIDPPPPPWGFEDG